MKVRILTLQYDSRLGGFSEDAVNKAVAGRELINVTEHFFIQEGTPHITLVLTLSDGHAKEITRPKSSTADPSKGLSEQQCKLYNQLRDWRKAKSVEEGVQSYLIFRNVQLAEICKELPSSLADLKEISGIGESTCKKYGKEILSLLPERIK